jgi:hypothetical protein
MVTNYCFILPILHGGLELIRKWKKENIVNNKEHDLVLKQQEYHVNWFGFNICHKETLQLPVMRLTTLNNH